MAKQANVVRRDGNILGHIRGEFSLTTRVKPSKKRYSRKVKHRAKLYD